VWPFCRKSSPEATDAVHYELAEPAEGPQRRNWVSLVEGFRQRRSPDGAIVTLTGRCLRCDHPMSVELPIKARTGKGVSPKADGQSLGKRAFTKVAFCNCGSAHEGRPDDCPDGCGAFGALLVGAAAQPPEVAATPAERYVSVIGQPNDAAVHDVAWERKVEVEAGQTLTTARTAAEKWTQTIAALTGVFSIVLVVKGPADISKVDGTVDLGLPTVASWLIWTGIAVAAVLTVGLIAASIDSERIEKALAGAGRPVRQSLLGGVALILALLVAVWADASWSHFTLIVVLLGAAAVLAATAIITGGLAAFGLPSGFIAASGAILRHRQMKQTLLTRSLLRGSLYAATVTVVVVGAAIAVTWTQTASAKPDSVLVVRDPGAGQPQEILCGPLASSDLPGGLPPVAVAVDTSKGAKTPESVPIAQVRLLVPVSSCGAGAP
jgi:hypothetical protein